MPQPRLAAARQHSTPPASDERATIYCTGCKGFHGIDAETRARWLAYASIEHDDELALLETTYGALDHMLRTLGPIADKRPGSGSGMLEDLLNAGQEYIDQLDRLLYPTSDDLIVMDLE